MFFKRNRLFNVLTASAAFWLSTSAVNTQKDPETVSNDLPPADAGMRQLDWFLGDWQAESRYDLGEDKGWLQETIKAIHKPVLGGHVILEHFIGPVFDGPFEAWSLRKYNPGEDRWEQRWVDTTPGGFADWTGHYSEGQFVGHPNRTLNEDGSVKEKALRETFYDIERDRFSWKLEKTTDQGKTWALVWSIEYTRIASE